MGFFDRLQKPGHTALKQQQHNSHKETRADLQIQYSSPKLLRSGQKFQRDSSGQHSRPSSVLKGARDIPKERRSAKDVSNARKRASTTPQRQEWGDDEEGDLDEELHRESKRRRRGLSLEKDPHRTLSNGSVLASDSPQDFKIVHAAEVANFENSKSYEAAFPKQPEVRDLFLRYPSANSGEKYELVVPKNGDDFAVLEDIRETLEVVIAYYLPTEISASLSDDSTGIVRRLKRAIQQQAGQDYLRIIDEWNAIMTKSKLDRTFFKTMQSWTGIDLRLCERVLTQIYSRTVSLAVNDLRRYKNGEDNVYGELLPKFVSTILRRDTKMRAGQIFVDLGSGVGNVVLQAALEVGCESWGCEIMPSACRLANMQQREFEARCSLWGISVGSVQLVEGNFLIHERIRNILSKADVILVNNQAFTPKLNEDLINLFLDLKEGAKVVSLKSFAPVGAKGQMRNAGAIYNIFDVVEKTYYDKKRQLDKCTWHLLRIYQRHRENDRMDMTEGDPLGTRTLMIFGSPPTFGLGPQMHNNGSDVSRLMPWQ